MSTSNVSSTMNLGFVTINNTHYLAILHFKDEEGNDLPIKPEMEKTKTIALKLFQKVLTEYSQGQEESQTVSHVDGNGFHLKEQLIADHTYKKTENSWKAFIQYLYSPIADIEDEEEERGPQLELIPLECLRDVDLNQLKVDLYEKINKAKEDQSDFPALTIQERLFLQSIALHRNYPNFLAGQFNDEELRNLQTEAYS